MQELPQSIAAARDALPRARVEWHSSAPIHRAMMSTRDPSELPSELSSSPEGPRSADGDARRAHPRANFPARALVQWTRHDAAPEVVETADLGMGGMRMASSRRVEVGQLGRVVQILPERTEMGVDFVVVWTFVRRFEDPMGEETERHEFGVRFLERD